MKVTLLKRSSTTCTTVPLALGYFLVSVSNALAGMKASVVSTVALAIVPFRAADPAPRPAGDFSLCILGDSSNELPFGRAVSGTLPRRRGDDEPCRSGTCSSASDAGEDSLDGGADDEPSCIPVPVTGDLDFRLEVSSPVSIDDDRFRGCMVVAGEIATGLADLRPIVQMSIGLTSEFALALTRELGTPSESWSLG